MTLLLEMFTYPFIVRAFAAGVLLSLCAALLGVPLVLKRYSMIGDGLSHVSFGALSVALACGWAPLPVSIPVVIVAALGLLRMTERSRMGADAAIAVVSASSLAVGVIVTSLTTGMTTDVDSYMFGSILAMTQADVVLSALLCVGVLVLFVLFYHRLFAITFDESFSRATGVKVGLYNTLLSVLTALTIVLGMRMMGAMLISSLVIFPALSAMRVRKSFRGVVVLAGVLSVLGFCVGLTGSYLLSTPVGASVVVVDLLIFLLCCGVRRVRPFVCGAKDLGEALRRINQGASMIRTKGEPGTGDVVQAVRHMRMMNQEIAKIVSMREDELFEEAKVLRVPYDLVEYVHKNGRLPVVNFAAGGVATPADAALMMQLGAEGVFVGSGIFKSGDPKKRAAAIVKAVTNYTDQKMLAELSEDLGEAMVGINEQEIKLLMAERGK